MAEKDVEQFSRTKIYELAMHNPIAHSCVTLFQTGHLTFEEALVYMVLALSKQNDDLMKREIDRAMKSATSHV